MTTEAQEWPKGSVHYSDLDSRWVEEINQAFQAGRVPGLDSLTVSFNRSGAKLTISGSTLAIRKITDYVARQQQQRVPEMAGSSL